VEVGGETTTDSEQGSKGTAGVVSGGTATTGFEGTLGTTSESEAGSEGTAGRGFEGTAGFEDEAGFEGAAGTTSEQNAIDNWEVLWEVELCRRRAIYTSNDTDLTWTRLYDCFSSVYTGLLLVALIAHLDM
jgi:hypothetical protein